MAKATLGLMEQKLTRIEGSIEEIKKILSSHGLKSVPLERPTVKFSDNKKSTTQSSINLNDISNAVSSCDEAEAIEKNILDRSGQVDRVLLPLYITNKHFGNKFELTSGEISKILKQVGINILQPNVASILSSVAKKYVIGDKMRKKGQPVRYKLSHRGVGYIGGVVKNISNDK